MTPELMLKLANIGAFLLAFGVPAVIFLLPRPRSALGRAAIAVLLVWVAVVLYACLVINPVGIAAGRAAGDDFPEARYDNNTIASGMLFGWVAPLVSIGVAAAIRRMFFRKAAPMTERTPNTSLERTREG